MTVVIAIFFIMICPFIGSDGVHYRPCFSCEKTNPYTGLGCMGRGSLRGGGGLLGGGLLGGPLLAEHADSVHSVTDRDHADQRANGCGDAESGGLGQLQSERGLG